MKDTNAIERALKKKIDFEVENIVRGFINELTKLYDTYGGTQWYNIVYDAQEKEISCLSKEKVRNILERMIKENHEEAMLNKKSKELLAKLEIL